MLEGTEVYLIKNMQMNGATPGGGGPIIKE